MIRILTLNIHKGFSVFNQRFMLHELRDAIRSAEPDLVFLQEVQGEHTEKESVHVDWPDAAQYEFLADEVWQDYAYGKNAVYTEGHHGNAILSKYPIDTWDRVDISTNRIEQRGHLYCKINLVNSATPLHCVCIHLGLSALARRKQFNMIAEYINAKIPSNEPLIIAGDTNDWSGFPTRSFARLLNLDDASSSLGGKQNRTFPSKRPLLGLDRILVRGIEIQSCQTHNDVIWKNLSDHIPISADLNLQDRSMHGE